METHQSRGALRVVLTSLILHSGFAFAQDGPTTTEPPKTTSLANNQRTTPLPFASSSLPFLPSNSAPAGNPKGSSAAGLVNYYLLFLALIVAAAAAVIFLMIRRRRRAVMMRRHSQNQALSQDLGGPRPGGGWANWNPERVGGQYWNGQWHGTETGRQEGLNEHGEAPPPYFPKGQPGDAQREGTQPAVPLQSLSRDGAGLRPPEYNNDQSYNQASMSSSPDNERRNP